MGLALHWTPCQYARSGRFVADFGIDVAEMLAPQRGERILDLGCGDGMLSRTIAERGAVVVGIDCQPAMVAAARARGIDARLLDARHLPFAAEFDAAFSNAALHWMGDLDAVAAGVFRALVPGGRIVGELGASGNIASVRHALSETLARRGLCAAALDPWTFPDAPAFAALLGRHGFTAVETEVFARPTELQGPFRDWLETFAQPFLDALPAEARASFAAEVEEVLPPTSLTAAGRRRIDYVRLRFRAWRPQ